jgi:tryptophanyl-tRNA synthetase
MCNQYKLEGKTACTQHKIEARDLYDAVLADIQSHARRAVMDDDAFLESLINRLNQGQEEEQKAILANARKAAKRLEELDDLYQQLYEDRAAGRISERNFTRLSAKYEQEQDELEQLISECENSKNLSSELRQSAEFFLEIVRPYANIRELDAAVLNSLIDKITVS